MEAIISKELLCEVYSEEVDFIRYVANNTHEVYFKNPTRLKYQIVNIYELAHKCKDWAKLKELTLFSGAVENSDNEFDLEWSYDCQIFSHKEGIELFYIKCESEPEAIFKACQWILENKEED